MAYVTDFTKTPKLMLIGLINNDNNFGLTEADVAFRNLAVEVAPEGKTYNTSVEVDLLTDEVADDYVKFFYKRVDLVELFSLINPKFREVDVPVDAVTGLPMDNEVFVIELLRKFGVAFNAADFTWVLKPEGQGLITLTATAANLAYTGSIDIDVEASLATRVDNTLLDGFYNPNV
jgi:hypothetical protein